MNIIETDFDFQGGISARKRTDKIILHHRAGRGDVMSIHKSHIEKGWVGIGYHFYVRRDGSIYRGRPIEMAGAHCLSHNAGSIGICFEGDFTKEIMGIPQLEAGRKLIAFIEELYLKRLEIVRHSDLANTLCPGDKFPFSELVKVSSDDMVTKMYEDNIITFNNVSNWEMFLSGKSRPKAEYIRTIIRRYQNKLDKKEE